MELQNRINAVYLDFFACPMRTEILSQCACSIWLLPRQFDTCLNVSVGSWGRLSGLK